MKSMLDAPCAKLEKFVKRSRGLQLDDRASALGKTGRATGHEAVEGEIAIVIGQLAHTKHPLRLR
jgi:hypothetical protein